MTVALGQKFKILFFCILCSVVMLLVVYLSFELGHITAVPRIKWNQWQRRHVNTTTSNSTSVLIIFWTKAHGITPSVNKDRYGWPYFYAGNNCPVNCTLTTDKSRIGEASAIVAHARNPNEIPPADQEPYKSLTWILTTHENPLRTRSLRDPQFMSKFNYLVSYRLDADFPSPQFRKPMLNKPIEFQHKTGFVMAAYSHCESVRTAYISELMKYIKVDSYGACLHNKEGLNKRYDPNAFREVRKLQRKYKFSLIFPNADCDYYMTEKIHNALSAGSVPVWLGTDKIDEILKWGNLNHSIIKVKDFPSPQKLAQYLLDLSQNETEYNKYLKWKYEGFQFPKEYYSSAIGQWWDGLPLYCRICMELQKNPKGHDGLQVDKCDGKQKRTLEKWVKFV